MGLFADGFKELKKASVPLYKTPKSIQETIEIMKVAENGIFESIDVLKDREYDMILIAISDPYIQKNVQKELIDKGIKFDKMWALRTENVLELIEA